MKRIFYSILTVCALFVTSNSFSQTLQEEGIQIMKGIRHNTQPDIIMDDVNLVAFASMLIAILSYIISRKTYKEQKTTANNTNKLSQEGQKSLLNDLIRHLYRNYVITFAMRSKLVEIDFQGYPSEEHLYKLQIPMENIHLDVFLGEEKNYKLMHNLYLNLRNYNEEILVALTHFMNKDIDLETKLRDFDTLEFKVSYLIGRIVNTEYEIWGEQEKNNILSSLNVAINDVTSATNNIPVEGCDNFKKITVERINKTYFAKLLDNDMSLINDFTKKLNNAIKQERMLNARGAEKVHIIKF